MRTVLTIIVPLALAACGGQPAQQAPAPVETGISDIQKRIAALSDAERNVVFIRAIRDAGMECQQVTSSEARPDAAAGPSVWTARCSGGASYGVVIGRDGTAQVVGAR